MAATWPKCPAAVAPTLFASPVCLPLFKSRCLTPSGCPHWLIRAVCAVLRLPRGGACCLGYRWLGIGICEVVGSGDGGFFITTKPDRSR